MLTTKRFNLTKIKSSLFITEIKLTGVNVFCQKARVITLYFYCTCLKYRFLSIREHFQLISKLPNSSPKGSGDITLFPLKIFENIVVATYLVI